MTKKKSNSAANIDIASAIGDLISNTKKGKTSIGKYISTLENSIYSDINEYIDTGSFALNRLISGTIFGGIPSGRVISFYGDSGVGKSFAAGKAIKKAQEMNYMVLYYDSENAITKLFASNIGIDPSLVSYTPIDEISDFKNHVLNEVPKIQDKYPGIKIMIVLDSLGNLSCAQEKAFIEKGTNSVTQGAREREIKSMLKELTKFCGLHQIPFIFTNHSIKPQDTAMLPKYVKDKQGGGKQATYMASATILMSKRKLKKEDASSEDKKTTDDKKKAGSILTCESTKNRLCQEEEKIELYLSFASGLNKYYGLAPDAVAAGCFEKINEKNYFVKHLDKKVNIADLYNKVVFTDEVLKQIDDYCKDAYAYSKAFQDDEDALDEELKDILTDE